jgi:GntR family transcriptional regulator
LLALPAGSPALAIERRAYLEDGRAVEFTRSLYRGDAYDFVAELQSER